MNEVTTRVRCFAFAFKTRDHPKKNRLWSTRETRYTFRCVWIETFFISRDIYICRSKSSNSRKNYSFISYTGLPHPLIVRMTINIVKLINAYGTLHRTQLYTQSLSKICDIRVEANINGKYRRWKKKKNCVIRRPFFAANTLRTTSAIVHVYRFSSPLLLTPIPRSSRAEREATLTF